MRPLASVVLKSTRRIFCLYWRTALQRLGQDPRLLREGSCRRRIASISTGEIVSTSPMLSKPLPRSSVGVLLGVEFDAEQILIMLIFCQFSRRAVTSGIRLEATVGLFELVLQVLDDGIHLRRARHAFRGQLAGTDLRRMMSSHRGFGERRRLRKTGRYSSAGGKIHWQGERLWSGRGDRFPKVGISAADKTAQADRVELRCAVPSPFAKLPSFK